MVTPTDYTGLLSENTISIRIAAVDTPEIGKFGKVDQAYSQEAKDFASSSLLGKKVGIKLLAKDRYGRALGLVKYKDNKILPGFMSSRKDISEELLEKGLAAVYRQGGAQYDGPVARWNDIESRAQKRKKGMWKGAKVELPSEYKKKNTQAPVKTQTPVKAKDYTRI
jgi:micrococcal nuclease